MALVTAMAVTAATAQTRYHQEVFAPDQITVTSDVTYGTNVDFMTSDFTQSPPVINTIQLKLDVYQPDQAEDEVTARPLVIYAPTGNFLPPPINGSPTGLKTDSTAVEICKRFARRGFVAASVAYRHGWNPLGGTLQIRRGTLLNAVFRAIHDLKQSVRFMRADAAGPNTYAIDPNKVLLIGEGSGGYLVQAYLCLDQGAEMFIEKFRPDPFDPEVSYIDTNTVGNIEGFGGTVNLYTPNGQSSEVQMAINLGGSLADTSWADGGESPLVSFHTVLDPFAPFGNGIVIVPTTGEQVVDVSGSNIAQQLWNNLGNNDVFANLADGDPYTDRARSLYGTTVNGVTISSTPEGLFPLVRNPLSAPLLNEASPWQWWDPNSPLATAVINPGPPPITAHMASLASNPDMSANKGRTYIDTIMGYSIPRVVCALQLGVCGYVGVEENTDIAIGVEVYPNPANDRVNITSSKAMIRHYDMRDVNGRRVRQANVTSNTLVIDRQGLESGVYTVTLHFDSGTVTRKVVLQ